ncbi:MAG: hypothetical protein RIR98_958 [Bacteroidota bacterium]
MGEELKHIDALFKQGLGDAKLSPPDGLFEQCVEQLNQGVTTGGANASVASGWSTLVKLPLVWVGVAALVSVTAYFVVSGDKPMSKNSPAVADITEKKTAEADKVGSSDIQVETTAGGIDQKDNQRFNQSLSHQQASGVADGELPVLRPSVVNSDAVTPVKVDEVSGGQKSSKVMASVEQTKPCKDVLGGWQPVIAENVGGVVSLALNGRFGDMRIHWGDGEKSSLHGLKDYTANSVSHTYFVAQKKTFTVKMVNVAVDAKTGLTCADSQRLSILVLPADEVTEVFVPDVFTPNGDGTNDLFFVEMPKPLQFDITILDANNRTVFRSNDYQAKWSGMYANSECKEDVYRVIVTYKYSGDKEWKYIRKQIKLIRN